MTSPYNTELNSLRDQFFTNVEPRKTMVLQNLVELEPQQMNDKWTKTMLGLSFKIRNELVPVPRGAPPRTSIRDIVDDMDRLTQVIDLKERQLSKIRRSIVGGSSGSASRPKKRRVRGGYTPEEELQRKLNALNQTISILVSDPNYDRQIVNLLYDQKRQIENFLSAQYIAQRNQEELLEQSRAVNRYRSMVDIPMDSPGSFRMSAPSPIEIPALDTAFIEFDSDSSGLASPISMSEPIMMIDEEAIPVLVSPGYVTPPRRRTRRTSRSRT